MGGWSGGVYSRFRNWVTDKANSVNPQASLFDQEDDGFAAGLNNCVTKDGLNKPSSAMDWNGQNLSGVLNLTVNGTLVASGNITLGNNTSTATALNFGNATSNPTFSFLGTGLTTISGNLTFASATLNLISLNNPGSSFLMGLRATATNGNSVEFGRLTASATWGASYLAVSSDTYVRALDDGGTMQVVGWRDLPQRNVTANTTLALADRGGSVQVNTGSATQVTIPANASVAFPSGTTILIVNNSNASINIAITTDALVLAGTASTGTRTLAVNGLATIYKSSATVWFIGGTGIT